MRRALIRARPVRIVPESLALMNVAQRRPLFLLPPEQYIAPFRERLQLWWQHWQHRESFLFLPCWIRLPMVQRDLRPNLHQLAAALGDSGYAQLLTDCQWLDWQKDVFSGYRWEKGDYVSWRNLPGADPKVPWELGRLQFLPILAILAHLEPAKVQQFWEQFRCVVLDFFLQNPVGQGIQWASPLEVAVRSFSLLLAAGLFHHQQLWEESLERLLWRRIAEHGLFLMHRLEWNAGLRGNHYLGDVVALLSIGAALGGYPVAAAWLAFGISELASEVLYQFLPDGGNWEGSTYYHRFALEMVLAGTAVALGLSPEQRHTVATVPRHLWRSERPLPPGRWREQVASVGTESMFPAAYWERLQAAVQFAAAITKPNGYAPQIGDHDSGRWLKLIPRFVPLASAQSHTYELPEGESIAEIGEEHRDFRPTLGLAATLCCRCPEEWEQQPEAFLFPRYPILEIREPAAVEWFPDFGLVVYRWNGFFLAVRCGGLERLHPSGGHAHCDQLSLELCLGTSDVFVDPGTYCYTASPEWRNRFRATAAHNTLVVSGEEQFRFFEHSSEALFWLFRRGVQARALIVQEREFVGEFLHPRYRHRRHLYLLPDGVEGRDIYEGPAPAVCSFNLAPEVRIGVCSTTEVLCHTEAGTLRFCGSAPIECIPSFFSSGYYVRQRTHCIRLPVTNGELRWRIQLLEKITVPCPRPGR